jgi:hypothetical protein
MCKAGFLCVVYGKVIRNVNTCNYNNKTDLVIITHCGPWPEVGREVSLPTFPFEFLHFSNFHKDTDSNYRSFCAHSE